jgi:hypothetical protein
MFRTIAVAAALMLTTVTMVSAQGQGDARERAACRPDVMRFCKQLIKDNNDDVIGILNCLQSNRPRISKACNQVLVSHGQ